MESKGRTLILKFLTLALITFCSAKQAFADGGGGSELGFLYGLSVPDVTNTSPHELFGVKGSTYLSPMFSVGGYYLQSGHSQGHNGLDFDFTMTGIDAAFHIPNGGGDTYIGIRGGITKLAMSPGNVDVLYSPYHYGLMVGYDYYVTSWLSFGFEGSYTHNEISTDVVNGTTYTQDKWSLISFLAGLSFRF